VWSPNWVRESEWHEALQKLKKEGKIRFIGVSINDQGSDEALELAGSGMADTIQVIYNIFEQSPADRLFPLCRKKNVGIIARVPLDEGSLTGKLTKDSKFAEGDWRKDYFSGEALEETVKRVEKLKFLVRDEIKSLAAGALKFCLSHPAASTLSPGIRSPTQAEQHVSASDGKPLKPEELEELERHRWDRK
jgi:aryl-alcohol dehydrogenase-like predicted oxidoreductase